MWRPLRQLFLLRSCADLQRAWLHHLHALQSTDKPLDATRYLYERLNIIDRKADMILRLNLLSLTFLALMASIFLREVVAAPRAGGDASVALRLYTGEVAVAVAIIFGCVAISSLLTYSIGGLRLDYVTSDPPILANLRARWPAAGGRAPDLQPCDGKCDDCPKRKDAGSSPAAQLANNRPCPNDRRWWAAYDAAAWERILGHIPTRGLERRSAYEFDLEFLKTIIARQRMLTCARSLTWVALIAYFFVLFEVLRASCILAALSEGSVFRPAACTL